MVLDISIFLIIAAILTFPITALAEGTAERSFSLTCYNSSEAFTVLIDVVPDAGTKSWACDDQPPSGWIVKNISDGGVWDNNFRKVKWFFIKDDTPRLLSYDIKPPEIALGTVIFTGRASFDGPTIETGGESSLDCCPPSITSNPVSASPNSGESVLFSVIATGNGVLSYQWTKNGSQLSDSGNIFGSKTESLTIDPAGTGHTGKYICEVSDACGLTLSAAASLILKTSPSMPVLPDSPAPDSMKPGDATLKVNETPSVADNSISQNTRERERTQISGNSVPAPPLIDAPAIYVTPSEIVDFGYVAIGKSSCKSYAIQNVGRGALTGSASSNNPVFVVHNRSYYNLGQNKDSIIPVCFAPDHDGFSSATLTFTGGGDAQAYATGYGYYPHFADADGDMKIVADEITLYASEWRRGKHDCKDCVTHGATIYLKSEKYKISGDQDPDCRRNCRDSIMPPDVEQE